MRIEVTYFGQFYSPQLQGNIQNTCICKNNFAFLKITSFCFEKYSISLRTDSFILQGKAYTTSNKYENLNLVK